jgi:hypothetical protein
MVLDLALIGGLLFKFTDFLKYVSNAAWTQAKTQVIVWGAGVGLIFLLGATHFGGVVTLNGVSLLRMNAGDKILLGLCASSLFASLPNDLKKAIDMHDTAAVPPLRGLPETRRVVDVSQTAPTKTS